MSARWVNLCDAYWLADWRADFPAVSRGCRLMIEDYHGSSDAYDAMIARQEQQLFGLEYALALYRDGTIPGYLHYPYPIRHLRTA